VEVIGFPGWIDTVEVETSVYRGGTVPKRVLFLAGASGDEKLFVIVE
jgi:hypothetical protein